MEQKCGYGNPADKRKKYVQGLEGYLKNLLLVGISYNRKTKKHECHIEKYEE